MDTPCNSLNESNCATPIQALRDALPPFFTRRKACEVLGGILTPKTLANYDSQKEGPPVRVQLGNKVGYERESFVAWLEGKMKQE